MPLPAPPPVRPHHPAKRPIRAAFVGRYERYNPPKPVNITNVAGDSFDQPAAGAVAFERAGKTWRLDAFEEGDGRLFIVFGDQTNAFETYGGGRFLDTDAPAGDGRVVIDFNKAYNPPCALSTYALCPLPPRQNRLPLAVQAGEKTFRGTHG